MIEKEKVEFVKLICENTEAEYYTATRWSAMESVAWYVVNNYDVTKKKKLNDE
jgi:hypothetical protein